MLVDKKVSTPAYWQLADIFKKKIKSGEFAPGSFMPSESRLAKKFGVSRGTARAALKLLEETGAISCDSTRGRIINHANAPSQPVSSFSAAPPRAFTIGVFPYQNYYEGDIYYSRILNGLSEGAFNQPIKIKYILQSSLDAENCSLNSYLHREGIDALLWLGGYTYDEHEMRKIKDAGFPVLMFNAGAPEHDLNYVTCDHYGGGVRLMNSLAHMGHKKIAFVGRDSQTRLSIKQRFQAYKDMHERYNLKFRPEWCLETESALENVEDQRNLKKNLRELFARRERPTAIFSAAGSMAKNILQYINELGLKTPEDVSVVCFDKMNLPPEMLKITCVEQPIERMAQTAVGVLSKNLNNPNTATVGITMEPEFIPGNSCAWCNEK